MDQFLLHAIGAALDAQLAADADHRSRVYARSGKLGGSVLQFGRQFRCRILAPTAMYHRREEGLRDSLDLAP
jgi:hypothetical protein